MEAILSQYKSISEENISVWYKAAHINDVPENGGACIKYQDKQIAVFYFKRLNKWYACQNLCPHKLEMVLSRGMLGETKDQPKIACPIHKKTFSLETGENLNGSLDAIATYPIKIEKEYIYIGFNS